MSLSLPISDHTLVMESLKLGPRVKLFESYSSLKALTLGPSSRDSITKVWPEIERLMDIFAVTHFTYICIYLLLLHNLVNLVTMTLSPSHWFSMPLPGRRGQEEIVAACDPTNLDQPRSSSATHPVAQQEELQEPRGGCQEHQPRHDDDDSHLHPRGCRFWHVHPYPRIPKFLHPGLGWIMQVLYSYIRLYRQGWLL